MHCHRYANFCIDQVNCVKLLVELQSLSDSKKKLKFFCMETLCAMIIKVILSFYNSRNLCSKSYIKKTKRCDCSLFDKDYFFPPLFNFKLNSFFFLFRLSHISVLYLYNTMILLFSLYYDFIIFFFLQSPTLLWLGYFGCHVVSIFCMLVKQNSGNIMQPKLIQIKLAQQLFNSSEEIYCSF